MVHEVNNIQETVKRTKMLKVQLASNQMAVSITKPWLPDRRNSSIRNRMVIMIINNQVVALNQDWTKSKISHFKMDIVGLIFIVVYKWRKRWTCVANVCQILCFSETMIYWLGDGSSRLRYNCQRSLGFNIWHKNVAVVSYFSVSVFRQKIGLSQVNLVNSENLISSQQLNTGQAFC